MVEPLDGPMRRLFNSIRPWKTGRAQCSTPVADGCQITRLAGGSRWLLTRRYGKMARKRAPVAPHVIQRALLTDPRNAIRTGGKRKKGKDDAPIVNVDAQRDAVGDGSVVDAAAGAVDDGGPDGGADTEEDERDDGHDGAEQEGEPVRDEADEHCQTGDDGSDEKEVERCADRISTT